MLRLFRRKKKHTQSDSAAVKGSSAPPASPPPFAVSAGSGRLPPLSAAPASPRQPAPEPTTIAALHRISEASACRGCGQVAWCSVHSCAQPKLHAYGPKQLASAPAQAQHLLTLRRNLLEKKIAAEEARARECAQRGNKRGERGVGRCSC